MRTISIVIAVLNSPEVVRRQIIHFREMPLPEGVELILVDDKSEPPLKREDYDLPQLRIFRHEVKGMWTQPAARNYGVRQSTADYIICTDIDHIITLPLLKQVLSTDYDFIKFKREVAILDEHGLFRQTKEDVLEYGYLLDLYDRKGFHIAPHTNSFAIRRELYWQCGGVSEQHVGRGIHPNREELPLRRRLRRAREAGTIHMLDRDSELADARPMIYMFPNGRYCGDKDYNPFGLFHNLPRKTRPEQWT